MRNQRSTISLARNAPMTLLLLSLVFLLIVVPVFETFGESVLVNAGFTAILIAATIVSRRKQPLFVVHTVIGLAAALILWAEMIFAESKWVVLVSCFLGGFFTATAAVLLVKRVVGRYATLDSIMGAASAYLLLGLTWAIIYWGVARTNDQAFDVSHAQIAAKSRDSTTPRYHFSQFVYFSFVTMSTLGYGDVIPRTPLTQTIAWMQAVVGQFFVAVIVAWLVGALPKPVGNRDEGIGSRE